MTLSCILDQLFTENNDQGFNEVSDIIRDLESAKQQVQELQHKLDSLKKRVLADLTVGIKSRDNSMNVALDQDQCTIGKNGCHVDMQPDFHKKIWIISSPDTNIMRSIDDNEKILSSDLHNIISSILGLFQPSESIHTKGKLLLEGRRATLVDVIRWKTPPKPLNSRSRQKKQ